MIVDPDSDPVKNFLVPDPEMALRTRLDSGVLLSKLPAHAHTDAHAHTLVETRLG